MTYDNAYNLILNTVTNIKYTDIFKMMSYNNFTYFIFQKLYNYIKDPTEYNLYIIQKNILFY